MNNENKDQVTKEDVIEVAQAIGLDQVPDIVLRRELLRREIIKQKNLTAQMEATYKQMEGQVK